MTNIEKKTVKTTQALVEEMQSIISVMEKENELINARNYASFEEIRIEKTSRLRSYQSSYRMLLEKPDILKEATEGQKALLKETAYRLAHEVEKNAMLVKTALQATQSLLQTIMNAARKDATKKMGYGDLRKENLQIRYDSKCDPVAVCRTV